MFDVLHIDILYEIGKYIACKIDLINFLLICKNTNNIKKNSRYFREILRNTKLCNMKLYFDDKKITKSNKFIINRCTNYYHFKKFNFSSLKLGDNCIILGNSEKMKYHILSNFLLLLRHNEFDKKIIIIDDNKLTNFYKNIFGDSELQIYNEYTSVIFKKDKPLNKISSTTKNNLCVISDNIFSKDMMTDGIFEDVLFNGKKYSCFIWIMLNDKINITNYIKSYIKYICILPDDKLDLKKVFNIWQNYFPNYKIFEKIMASRIQNNKCLMIDGKIQNNLYGDIILYGDFM